MTYPLFERYPALARALPRLELAELPTPLQVAADAAKRWSLGELLIKRDDLSAERYGGNKIRKLELLLADAQRRGCAGVITYGAAGSNHALATAIYAHELGLECHAVLTPQPPTPKVARTLRYHRKLGTRLHAAANLQEVEACTERLLAAQPGGAAKLYRVPWGGSSWLGTVGFVNAALELAQQLAGRRPDFIYSATGTMGTTIGLALGLRLLGWSTQIMAVRVVPQPVMNPEYFLRLYQETNRELHELDAAIPIFEDPESNVRVRDGFLGDGYALPTEGTHEAVRLARELIGLELETTYTGKAMAALIHDGREGALQDQCVVFWQTYNSRAYPSLDAHGDELLEPFAHYFE